MSEQTCKNTTTIHSHCFGSGDDSACDKSGVVGVLKSGGGVAGRSGGHGSNHGANHGHGGGVVAGMQIPSCFVISARVKCAKKCIVNESAK